MPFKSRLRLTAQKTKYLNRLLIESKLLQNNLAAAYWFFVLTLELLQDRRIIVKLCNVFYFVMWK